MSEQELLDTIRRAREALIIPLSEDESEVLGMLSYAQTAALTILNEAIEKAEQQDTATVGRR